MRYEYQRSLLLQRYLLNQVQRKLAIGWFGSPIFKNLFIMYLFYTYINSSQRLGLPVFIICLTNMGCIMKAYQNIILDNAYNPLQPIQICVNSPRKWKRQIVRTGLIQTPQKKKKVCVGKVEIDETLLEEMAEKRRKKKKKNGGEKWPRDERGTPWRAITPNEDSVIGASVGTPLVEKKKPVSEWYHKQ
ncbi:hypothetical protein WN51_00908 [Melipona quadrifasciata]|uniref:Uncharacterized protein n=1 Tax=Melipona quadrifasciata TaxID=166423 RepID=A0A0M8ZVY2_9HYME|nr:hypothetical protein WN51_00908 [Melipona quadrifasciata]